MTKLLLLLNSFSPKEINNFLVFLENPLVNKREDVRELLRYWMKTRLKFKKEEGFQTIFSHQDFKVKTWHLLTSRLFKLAEQFIIFNELKDDDILQKTLLAKAYRKKQLPTLFESTINATSKSLEKTSGESVDRLHQMFTLEYEHYDYIASHNRKERTNLQRVNDLLDQYYISIKLRNACLALSRKTMNQEQYEIHFLQDALDKIEAQPTLLNSPAISMYYYCYKSITEVESEQWFSLLREAITAHSSLFKPAEKRDITLLAINYGIKKLNTGDGFYVRETFELYRHSFAEGYLLEDKIMPEPMYYNVVALAVKNKEFLWAQDFATDYKKFLNPIFQEPLYNHSMGLLQYKQGKLEESLQTLALVDTKISFVLLAVKSLQIKIYYELKEVDALDSLLESFRVYLQRRKDLGYRKENFENLVTFVKRLLSIPYKSKKEKEELIKEVKNATIFSEKEWLLSQLTKK
ncbi:MAG: hypothetical protein AB8F74_15850 [Saprospiraceae bacterium]